MNLLHWGSELVLPVQLEGFLEVFLNLEKKVSSSLGSVLTSHFLVMYDIWGERRLGCLQRGYGTQMGRNSSLKPVLSSTSCEKKLQSF